ncbi:VOC family protein [Pseudomonas sp. LFM046]|uniref:VOC family protein n=1 Tax=Pseudomonas sp. LFM046 TaxID=1608357 RepID=UPI0005CFCFF4|nr:VOC family protein [Pseudomonas sp. LFM046]
MSKALMGPIDQLGYLVDNLDQGMDRWVQRLGVGPWTAFRDVVLDGRYRGEAVQVEMNVGLAYQGDVQIELIEVVQDSASPYRDAQGRPLLGLHHIAWVVDDLDRELARLTSNGLQVVFEAHNPATRVAYLEDSAEPGVLFEIIQGAGMRDLIRNGIAVTKSWDGSQPIRTV